MPLGGNHLNSSGRGAGSPEFGLSAAVGKQRHGIIFRMPGLSITLVEAGSVGKLARVRV